MKKSNMPAREKQDNYTHPEFLVETGWLERHLDDPDLRIFDCTAYPAPNPDEELRKKYPLRPTSGRAHFEDEHIPGAGFIDIPQDLVDHSSELPMMMPPEKQFTDVVSACGVDDKVRVILYSSTSPMWASRVWWMLRSVGFNNASVLNGGWQKWVAENRPVSNDRCEYPPGRVTSRPSPAAFVDKQKVLSALGDKGVRLIHSLTPSFFDGSNDKLIFGRRGHIPGSVNIPAGSLHDPDSGVYLPAAKLRKVVEKAQTAEAERIITYCGGGINATESALALCLLGYENVAVYDGSMSEWGNDSSVPIKTN